MCVPACTAKIAKDMSRRSFLRSAAGVGAGLATVAVAGCQPIVANPVVSGTVPLIGSKGAGSISFSRLIDLTHTITEDFPTYFGQQQLTVEQLFSLDTDGFNLNQWLINEHTGTHMDAPHHFSDGPTADQLSPDVLHGPLVVVDIRGKAEADPDAQLTPEDLAAWEATNGEIPPGAIVALFSGWDEYVATDAFRNADDAGTMHFPGFHLDAIEFLLGERDVNGIFVDTLSLDYGPSPDFAVHYRWLPAGKWGIEGIAGLGNVPVSGAHVIVGGPKIAGATGGPSRVFALV